MRPELSVVIPARDVATSLGAQLDALLAQEWDATWEIVVVDNRSTDRTVAVTEEYARRDPRVRLAAAPDRTGLCYARATGFAAAAADAIAVCDGDDVVGPAWLRAMGEGLRLHPCVTGPIEVEELNPPWLAASRGRPSRTACATWFGVFPVLSGGNFGIHRHAWDALGGFDERYLGAEDHEFSLRLHLAGIPLHFSPDALVHYRYRTSARELWRQGNSYGLPRPLLWRRVEAAGLAPPPRFAGWRSWAWLGAHLTDLRTEAGRARWSWVAGNRIGQVRGSARYRTLFI